MFKGVKAFLYNGTTVVLDKSHIRNAKEELFQEVTLFLPAEFIKESYKELEIMGELIEEDGCD